MNHPYLAAGQEVNVVDPNGKPVKATITQVMASTSHAWNTTTANTP
jgi:hypothetical protein